MKLKGSIDFGCELNFKICSSLTLPEYADSAGKGLLWKCCQLHSARRLTDCKNESNKLICSKIQNTDR